MALRHFDGFEFYDSGIVSSIYPTNGNMLIDTTSGRTGSNCARFGASNATGNAQLTLDAQDTWIMGAAVKFGTLTAVDNVNFMAVLDGSTVQCGLRLKTDGSGKIDAYRGTTLIDTGTVLLQAGVWYYIEAKFVIADSGGTITTKVNGITDISFTGDTKQTANAYADRIFIGGWRQQSGYIRFDDWYACDGTGSSPTNDFLGDCKVETIMPDGNGNSSGFVGSDADSTDNYLLVDETPQNDATDYVEGASVGDKDTYTYGDLVSTAGAVYGVKINTRAIKTDAGARSIATVARISGESEVDGPDIALSQSWQNFWDIREAKPGGGSWAIGDVNGAEFGAKVTV